jgi:hypothetical protein
VDEAYDSVRCTVGFVGEQRRTVMRSLRALAEDVDEAIHKLLLRANGPPDTGQGL